jgi:hypothetical protein
MHIAPRVYNQMSQVYSTGTISRKYNHDRIFCRVIVFSVGSTLE